MPRSTAFALGLAVAGCILLRPSSMLANDRPPASSDPPSATKWLRVARAAVRVLAYDRTYAMRAAGRTSFLVVQRPHNVASETCGAELIRALAHESVVSAAAVSSRRIRAQRVSYVDAATFDWQLTRMNAGVVYLCPGVEEAAIVDAVNRKGVLSMGAAPTTAAIGFVPHGSEGGIRVVIRVGAARAAGARFTPPLLAYARLLP
jgi:hypothetical protein